MINITKTEKYCDCQSCGCKKKELLRTFYVGKGNNIKQGIILCIDCIGELVKQGMLYQPEEIEK